MPGQPSSSSLSQWGSTDITAALQNLHVGWRHDGTAGQSRDWGRHGNPVSPWLCDATDLCLWRGAHGEARTFSVLSISPLLIRHQESDDGKREKQSNDRWGQTVTQDDASYPSQEHRVRRMEIMMHQGKTGKTNVALYRTSCVMTSRTGSDDIKWWNDFVSSSTAGQKNIFLFFLWRVRLSSKG